MKALKEKKKTKKKNNSSIQLIIEKNVEEELSYCCIHEVVFLLLPYSCSSCHGFVIHHKKLSVYCRLKQSDQRWIDPHLSSSSMVQKRIVVSNNFESIVSCNFHR